MNQRITIPRLLSLSTAPLLRHLRIWWLTRQENHFLMSANFEASNAQQAQKNAAYFQKRAAMARSDRNAL